MPYVFEPPTRRQTHRLRGSLTYSYPVSLTVWKDASGGWHQQETPSAEAIADAVWINYGRSVAFDDDQIAAELIAADIGTCYQIV